VSASLTQQEAAAKCGISVGYLSKVETGKVNLGLAVLMALDRLGVSREYLFAGTPMRETTDAGYRMPASPVPDVGLVERIARIVAEPGVVETVGTLAECLKIDRERAWLVLLRERLAEKGKPT